MTATFQVGQVLQGQGFAEAIAAFQGYLARYPDGPQSADAQRADPRHRTAHRRGAPPARAVRRGPHRLAGVRAQNPLDPRCPRSSSGSARASPTEKKFDEAIAAWETLVGKFPGTEPAAHAQFRIAAMLEDPEGRPSRAPSSGTRRSRPSPGSRRPASGSR